MHACIPVGVCLHEHVCTHEPAPASDPEDWTPPQLPERKLEGGVAYDGSTGEGKPAKAGASVELSLASSHGSSKSSLSEEALPPKTK